MNVVVGSKKGLSLKLEILNLLGLVTPGCH